MDPAPNVVHSSWNGGTLKSRSVKLSCSLLSHCRPCQNPCVRLKISLAENTRGRSGAQRSYEREVFLARKFSIVRRARLVSAALACRRARKGPGMVGSVQLCGNFFCSCLGSSQRSPASSSPRSQQFSAGYTQQAAVPAFPEPCLGSSLLRTSSLEPGWEVRYFELV